MTWTISTFAFYIINFFVASEEEGGFDAGARASTQCEGLSAEYIQNLIFNTVEACELAAERYIVYEMVLITVPCVLASFYFSTILYHYWSNANVNVDDDYKQLEDDENRNSLNA